jgi:hypothetical protein
MKVNIIIFPVQTRYITGKNSGMMNKRAKVQFQHNKKMMN